MIVALGLLLVGLLFCWLAFAGWRNRHGESISLLEAVILKVGDDEPLPLTKFDRWLQKSQLIMISTFGPPMVFLGGYGLLSEIGAL